MNAVAVKLRTMKNERGLSNKDLADLSGVPIGTVNRVLAGKVEAPNLQTILDLVKAMNGSLDEVCGLTPEKAQEDAPPLSSEAVRAYESLLAERQRALDSKDRWIKRLFLLCCILAAVLIGVLIYDLLNPAKGFFLR